MSDKEKNDGGLQKIQRRVFGGGDDPVGDALDDYEEVEKPDVDETVDAIDEALLQATKDKEQRKEQRQKRREKEKEGVSCCGLYW